jgi:oligopeptide/dipeptide ABC transporter ATP-binding protein
VTTRVQPPTSDRAGAERTPPLMSVRDLEVWFDLPHGETLHAVQGVSFEIGEGERFGLVGESGCGKSTTILAMMGLLPPNATVGGQVLLDGADLLADGEATARPHRWVDISMIFQGAMNALNPVQTIGRQIVEPMELHDVASGDEARARAGHLLELVGIAADRLDRYPHEFSGGMRQRAAIAMALACDPKILLADEPTTALDVMVQAQILRLLERLSAELALTVVFVTHDLPLVAQVCDRAAVMYGGILAEVGPMRDLFHAPAHPYTRMLFDAVPDPTGGSEVVSIPGAPPRLDRPIPGCPFAPRCPSAFAPCGSRRPERIGVAPGHEARCHLNDPAEEGPR